jgi:hypothetical protein
MEGVLKGRKGDGGCVEEKKRGWRMWWWERKVMEGVLLKGRKGLGEW